MKSIYFKFLLFVCLTSYSYSQEYQRTLDSSNLKLAKDSIIPSNLLIKVNQDESGFTHVIVDSGVKEEAEFLIKPFSLELFKAKMKKNIFPTLKSNSVVPEKFLESNNDQALTNLYSDISSYFNTVNERPHVATVKLKSNIKLYSDLSFYKLKEKNSEKKKIEQFRVKIGQLKEPKIYMTFYSGFIEKIEVHGLMNSNEIKLSNEFSIGVSSESNIEAFNRIKLYSKYPYDLSAAKSGSITPTYNPNNQSNININGTKYNITIVSEERINNQETNGYTLNEENKSRYFYVYLSDLISYERFLDINANDISPAKQRIVIDDLQNSAKLYREESTKILEAVVYSDLLGALEKENPNGIIQTEINKKFNINTSRGDFLGGGAGMFEYLDARVLLSKIEEDNKFLLPELGEFEILNIYKHRNFSVGGLLNIFSFENQNLKMNVFYDSGFEFSRSGYKTSEDAEGQNLNAIQWSHQLKFHIFPEKRYCIIFRDKLFFYETIDDNQELLSILNKKKDWLNTIELSAYLDIATSAKIFVRYGLVHQLSDIDNNFSRFQIGTAFYFLQKNRKDKPN